jgi:very-short-patch-repair endonuclease
MRKIPEIIIENSRKLRKNMTESEKILWFQLKSKKLD